LLSSEHGFYAALDADSEGEEGKYYTWKKEEFTNVLGDHAAMMADYFNNPRKWKLGAYQYFVCASFHRRVG